MRLTTFYSEKKIAQRLNKSDRTANGIESEKEIRK